MSRSQRAVRFRDGVDSSRVTAAYALGERSLRTQLEQRAALLAAGRTTGVGPANTVLPAITGTVTVGQTLTCSTGTWTSQGAPAYTYQWLRGNTPISGATAATRVLAAADSGFQMTCQVKNTDAYGNTTVQALHTVKVP